MKTFGKISLVICMLLATSNTFAAKKPTNAELKIGLTQEIENLNPVIATMAATTYIRRAVGRNLVDMNDENKFFLL